MRVLNSLILATALAMPVAFPVAFSVVSPVMAEEVGRIEVARITVTGEATVQATPDMATISLGVTTEGKTAAAAMASNNAALQVVLDRLRAAGIEERDLQTSNLSLNPNWVGYDSGSAPTIAGYIATNMLSVRVRALDSLGGVLDAAITDGANTMNGMTFEVSEPRPVLDAARKMAVADARARALLLIGAAGGTLGRMVAISENAGYGAPQPMFRSASDSVSAVPVASGQVGLTASVTITYEFSE